MKEILGLHLDRISSDISDYLFENIGFIKGDGLFDLNNQSELDIIFGSGANIDRLNALLNNRTFLSTTRQDLIILAKFLVGYHLNNSHKINDSLKDLMSCKIAPQFAVKIDLLIKLLRVIHAKNNDAFIVDFEKLMNILPQDIQPAKIIEKYYLLHAEDLIEKRHLNEIVDLIVKYRQDSLNCLILAGNLFKEREDFYMAIDIYLKSIDVCKNNSLFGELRQICFEISWCYLKLIKPQKAIDFSNLSIELFNKYDAGIDKSLFLHKAYTVRAEGQFLLNNYELALQDINLALEFEREKYAIILHESIVYFLCDKK